MTPAHLRKYLNEIDCSTQIPQAEDVEGWYFEYRRLMRGLREAVEFLESDEPINRDQMSRSMQNAIEGH